MKIVRATTPLLLLAACATASAPPSPEALRGCWIERRGEQTLTLRAFPERTELARRVEREGFAERTVVERFESRVWRLDVLWYAPGEEPLPQLYRLQPTDRGWEICLIEEPHGPPCRDAFFGRGAETEGNGGEWMELRGTAETLSFTHHVAGERYEFFIGARDGCD